MAPLRQLEVINVIQSLKGLGFFHVTYSISWTVAGNCGVSSAPENLITMGKADSDLWGQNLSVS